MGRTKKVSWVVLGPEPYLATCLRCGVREPRPPMPLVIDYAVAWIRVALERHAHCALTPVPFPDFAGEGSIGVATPSEGGA